MEITLKGRKVPLLYTTYEMKAIQEEIGPLGKVPYMIFGMDPDNREDTSRYGSAEQLEAIASLIRILGNAGLEEAGEAPDLTNKKIMRSLKPKELMDTVQICVEAMNESMESEYPEKKPEGPVDVTLEEINKKKAKEG